jgi:hypothetical protein
MNVSRKPVLSFDTSAINKLADDLESEVLKVGLRAAFFVRFTSTNVEEIIATCDSTRRKDLLNCIRSLLTAGDCINPYHWIIEQLVRNFERDPKSFDWRQVSVRFQNAEGEVARQEFINDDLSAEQRQHSRTAAKKFEEIYTSPRPKFDSFFENYLGQRPSISELVEFFKRCGGAIWGLGAMLYGKVAQGASDETTIRHFYDVCPPFRALLLGLGIAIHERCVRDEKGGESYRAGRQDLLSAVYLPYCDSYVTDDGKQARCLQVVASECNIDVMVLPYNEFRSRLIGVTEVKVRSDGRI